MGTSVSPCTSLTVTIHYGYFISRVDTTQQHRRLTEATPQVPPRQCRAMVVHFTHSLHSHDQRFCTKSLRSPNDCGPFKRLRVKRVHWYTMSKQSAAMSTGTLEQYEQTVSSECVRVHWYTMSKQSAASVYGYWPRLRVGTALAVIVPEGAESFYEMRAHAEDANKVGAEHMGRSGAKGGQVPIIEGSGARYRGIRCLGGSSAHYRGIRCPLLGSQVPREVKSLL